MDNKETITETCFNCKWVKQGEHCMYCDHPEANPNGRGAYAYPHSNDTCDCGGFEKMGDTKNG